MNKKILGLIILATGALMSLTANTYSAEATLVTPVTDKMAIIAPEYNSNVSYNINTDVLNNSLNKTNSLYEVSCDSKSIFSNIWLNNTKKKIKTITYSLTDTFDITVDGSNCTIYGYTNDYWYKQDYFTETEWINIAKEFIKNNLWDFKINTSKYIVVSKWNNRPYPIAYANGKETSMSSTDYVPEIIDDNESNTYIDDKIYNMQVLFPIMLNNKAVYDQYGTQLWVTVDIANKKVSAVNGSLLNIKLINRKAKLIGFDDLLSLIKNGGNNPYYSYTNTWTVINFTSIDKVYVLFNTYDTKQHNYISTGLKLNTETKIPYQTDKLYTQIVSDFIIGNNQNYTVKY